MIYLSPLKSRPLFFSECTWDNSSDLIRLANARLHAAGHVPNWKGERGGSPIAGWFIRKTPRWMMTGGTPMTQETPENHCLSLNSPGDTKKSASLFGCCFLGL